MNDDHFKTTVQCPNVLQKAAETPATIDDTQCYQLWSTILPDRHSSTVHSYDVYAKLRRKNYTRSAQQRSRIAQSRVAK
eukprot:16052-Heterococcus_DN1.PRE.1